jgi:serine phosphatase RsbU (regulator of sigma subunit)
LGTREGVQPSPRVPKVLAVDDQPNNLLAVEALLSDLNLELVRAGSGKEALRRILEVDFALILMDVHMPGMDGFETAEVIRQRRRSQDTPIIFLTAVETADAQVFKGYALGAVDYLIKPIVPTILQSKVAVFLDIHRKADQLRWQAEQLRLLEQREHERELAEAKHRWEAESLREQMSAARHVQQQLFPVSAISVPWLDIAGASYMAQATGGDYFDYIPTADGSLALVVGDVSGHGIGPALLAAGIRAYLRAFLQTQPGLSEAMRLLNRSLSQDTDKFATLLIGQIDPDTRSLVCAGAGHLPGLVIDAAGSLAASLESTGIPLAVLPDTRYATQSVRHLETGDVVVLFTDGIVEAANDSEEMFGPSRVLQVVSQNRQHSAQEILGHLYRAVNAFCGTPQDDMTAVVVRVV